MRVSRSVLTVASVLALAACTDTVPTRPSVAPTFRLTPSNTGSQAPADYVVVFKAQRVPTDFADRVATLGGRIDGHFDAIGMATVSGLSETSAATLAKGSDVSSVLPDVTVGLKTPATHVLSDSPIEAQAAGAPASAILFARQWDMRVIHADEAWAAGDLGSPNVTVAILDTGIDDSYPDLVGRVDPSRSTSFVPSDEQLNTTFFGGSKPAYADYNGHGTNVATVVSSNAVVFAGVTQRTTLMAVKVLGATGSGSISGVLAGILYAVDNGADVINMSLGDTLERAHSGQFFGLVNRTINYAKSKGVTIVVAAGNDALDLDHSGNLYAGFCDAPNVICVAATGALSSGGDPFAGPFNGPFPDPDTPAFYTNIGRSAINVAAPGGNASFDADGNIVGVSWVWSGCSRTSLAFDATTNTFSPTVCSAFPQLLFIDGFIGTSQATPHVTGLAALLVEKKGRNPGQIRAAIQQSADNVGGNGTTPFFGKGRIDVARALGLN